MASLSSALRVLLASAWLAANPAAFAAGAAEPGATAPAAPASAPARVPAERPHITVIEDDNARIEEHRVRGVVTHVTVQSKVGGAPAYQIQVTPPGRESMSDRGSHGKRTWSLLRF